MYHYLNAAGTCSPSTCINPPKCTLRRVEIIVMQLQSSLHPGLNREVHGEHLRESQEITVSRDEASWCDKQIAELRGQSKGSPSHS